ncbi:hypothetical protein BGZ76_007404, partial [Entomortierella beljakovae]
SKFLRQQAKDASNATVIASSLALDQSVDSDAYLGPHQPQLDYFSHRPTHVRFQEPSTGHNSSFDQQSYKQPRVSQSTKKLTLQTQQINSPSQQKRSPMSPRSNRGASNGSLVNNGSPFYQNPNFLSPVDSPQTPPPAYFLKKIELPEIDSVGDLVSEFEVDFSFIQY